MKKYAFSLAKVLDYKEQILDAERNTHAAILAQLNAQQAVVDGLWKRYHDYNDEFCEAKATGTTITQALMYENGLRALERQIQIETKKRDALREAEEKQRMVVVEARKETASLEKLKEKSYAAYQKAVQKAEEKEIDELVGASYHAATHSA